MKKFFIALVVLIAIIGTGLFVLAGKIDGIIKDTIETEGTAALGAKVSLESVVTDLKQGSATLSKLTIANPAGYQAANAIELSSFSASVDYGNRVIENIEINQPVINAEQKGQRNNFKDLLDNMPSDETQEAESEADDTVITIKKLALRKATVNLLTSDLKVADQEINLGNSSFVMDDFVLTDLSGTATEISDTIVTSLTAHVSAQVQAQVKQQLETLAKARLAEVANEKIEEAKAKAEEKLKEKLGENLEGEVGEKLKGLKFKFGKKD